MSFNTTLINKCSLYFICCVNVQHTQNTGRCVCSLMTASLSSLSSCMLSGVLSLYFYVCVVSASWDQIKETTKTSPVVVQVTPSYISHQICIVQLRFCMSCMNLPSCKLRANLDLFSSLFWMYSCGSVCLCVSCLSLYVSWHYVLSFCHPSTAGKMEDDFPLGAVGVTSTISGSQSPAGRRRVQCLSAC